MHYNYNTEKLLGLQDVIVKNIEKSEKETKIYLDMVKKEVICPCCNSKTSKIHDYRNQKIKDLKSFDTNTILILRKTRYICKKCNKRFYPKLDFLPRYYRMTRRVIGSVLEALSSTVSYKSVAKQHNISSSTVIRIFDAINYPQPKELPVVLAIDEFKGNAGGEKYLAILTDPKSKKVIDILPKRNESFLFNYFKSKKRDNTLFFVSDMWKPYRSIQKNLFKESHLITDKYHFIRQVIWDFEKVRKSEQDKHSKNYRITFKRSKSLLTKSYNYLSDTQKQEVKNIFRISPTLENAHSLKELFLDILNKHDYLIQKSLLSDWIFTAQSYDIPEFKSSITALTNWFSSICNAFEFGYSNGFTEGCNNKIKVLKRVSYGVRNFSRFRNRILHIFNY